MDFDEVFVQARLYTYSDCEYGFDAPFSQHQPERLDLNFADEFPQAPSCSLQR